MLVITRRRNQSIKVGDHVVITVCDVRSGAVKLGVTAPADVDVCRTDESPSAAQAKRLCRRCRRWVESSVWSHSLGCCDVCGTEAASIHDDERYDGVDEENL